MSFRRALLLLCMALVLRLDAPHQAHACGGPDFGDFGALAPLDHEVSSLLFPDLGWASWGNWAREELRFLHPFRQARPAEIEPLWRVVHEGATTLPGASTAELERAIRDDDVPRAELEARRIIDAFLDMPSVPAAEHAAVMWRAVEIVELAPRLRSVDAPTRRAVLLGAPVTIALPPDLARAIEARAATPSPTAVSLAAAPGHPRAPSLELWQAMRELRDRIPNGYADAIKASVPAATFRDLHARFEAWTNAHPGHPLVDYARLFAVRVHYLAGDDPAAWQVLLGIYPRRLPRVLSEMRYLVQQGRMPSAQQIDALTDPLLVTALAGERTIHDARWARMWALAESDAKAAWSANLKERLLAWTAAHASPGRLPIGFPVRHTGLSPLAGKLRAVSLIRAGMNGDAAAALASLVPDAEQARLGVRVALLQGDAARAAILPEAGEHTPRYVLEVRASDNTVARVADGSEGTARATARVELGARLASLGKWDEAATLVRSSNPARSALWRKAGALARTPAQRLALARFLAEHHGTLFHPPDTGYYRGLSERYRSLSASARDQNEKRAIEQALTRSTERWLALDAYTRWLEDNPQHPEARAALAEADRTFSRLEYFGGGKDFFWSDFTGPSPLVARLRAVGKTVRRTAPP